MTNHAIVLVGVPPFTTVQNPKPKRRPGRPKKKDANTMATTQAVPATETSTQATAKVTRTVFDLQAFDDVKLSKTVTLPTKPTTLEEALTACGNDSEKLLDVIHEGLVAETKSAAYDEIEGFNVVSEDGVETPYIGKFADDAKGDLINKAILALAKINGYAKDLAPERKAELKKRATAFLRDNPAMLSSLQG